MDWTVFVVFILSITRIECGINVWRSLAMVYKTSHGVGCFSWVYFVAGLMMSSFGIGDDIIWVGTSLEEINEEVAATLIPSLTDSTTINNEAQQSTTAATTFVEEDKKNTTLENVVEGGNKNTTSEISGDIDVYYGFQASPVIVKVLGDDGRFHWYLTKEGVGDTQKKYHQYGLNYPQGYFSPYEYGSLSNLYNSYQNIFPLLEGHMFNKYPWSHPINYYVTQNGMSSPLTNVYTPYHSYPWNTAAPNGLYNQFPNNNHGLSSWYYQKPSLNPYYSNNRYSGITNHLNAIFPNFPPMMNYLDYINLSHMNPYDTASIFNQYPNIFQQSIYPNLNNFYYQQLINNELQRNPYNFMTQFPHWFNEYGLDNTIFQDQYKLLNNIGGYDQVNMLHRAHSLFPVKSYRSPYTSESPNYNSIYDFKQNNMGQTYTSSNYIPSTPNQLFWRMSHYKPSIQYNSDYLLCRSPNITPFLATSYDYINRLPLDPIYRLFFKVLITSLANLYPRNAYFDEPVYPYTYPNTYHYNV